MCFFNYDLMMILFVVQCMTPTIFIVFDPIAMMISLILFGDGGRGSGGWRRNGVGMTVRMLIMKVCRPGW